MKVTWAEGPHPPVRKELVVWRSCVQLQWYVFHRPSVSLSHALCSWLLGFQCAVGRCVGVEHPYVKESTFLLTSCSRTLELWHLAEHCLLCLVSFSGMFHQIGIEVLALFSHSHKLLSAAGLRFWVWSWWVEGNAPLEQLNACVVEENGAALEQWVSSLVVSPDCCWVGISRRHNGHSLQLCHFPFNSFAYKWKVEIPSSCLYYYNVPLHWYYNSASESFPSYQVSLYVLLLPSTDLSSRSNASFFEAPIHVQPMIDKFVHVRSNILSSKEVRISVQSWCILSDLWRFALKSKDSQIHLRVNLLWISKCKIHINWKSAQYKPCKK